MKTNPGPTKTALIIAFATIYLVWGSTYLGIRVAVETMPPFLMASLRFIVAGSLLLAFQRLRGPLRLRPHHWRDNIITGIFLLLGGNGLVSWAELSLPSGVTALIIGSQPLMMVLTAWAWPGGVRPGKLTMVGLLLGFAGVAWLAAPWESAAGGALPVGGFIAVLAACVFWAYGSIYSRHAREPAAPFTASALQMLAGSAALALVALARGEVAAFSPAAVSARSWLAFGYLTSVGSLVGFSTFVWLMKHSTPARVATYAYVNPIVAVCLGWLILREPITSRTLVASAVIVTAVAIITVQKSRSAPVLSAPAPAPRREAA
ncbi:MAG TPA: EamA family transporter [Opitutaceae bacterium]|nr:EamA family transporter [Opitutaceae bacterium]